MSKIGTIARNTIKKVYNNPVIFILIAACLALMASTHMYRALTMGLETQLMVDVSLALINLLGLVLAIYLGATSIAEEFEARTAHILLSKPVSRKDMVIGKFLGAWGAATIMVGVLTIGAIIIVGIAANGINWGLLAAGFLIICQVGVAAAFAVMYSTFLKPTTATIAATVTAIVFLMVYAIPGMGQGEYRLQAFGLSADQHQQLKQLVGPAASITLTESAAGGDMGAVPPEVNPAPGAEGTPPATDAPAAAPAAVPMAAAQNYRIVTTSDDVHKTIAKFLDERSLSSTVASGPTRSMVLASAVIPDLNQLNIKNLVGNGFSPDPQRYGLAVLYGILLMGAFVALGLYFIEQREIV